MFPYEFYKVLHIAAILCLFVSFGGAIWSQWANPGLKQYPGRKVVFIMHMNYSILLYHHLIQLDLYRNGHHVV